MRLEGRKGDGEGEVKRSRGKLIGKKRVKKRGLKGGKKGTGFKVRDGKNDRETVKGKGKRSIRKFIVKKRINTKRIEGGT